MMVSKYFFIPALIGVLLIGVAIGSLSVKTLINDACINLGMFKIERNTFSCELSSVKDGGKVFFVVPEPSNDH